jgi:GalNAc-alpha-(1->4)-GalNAc-alpha-(1->3)-diNAcBac-PP-undecaprenol alpha-1,4-N-acetyl-D-galactosaminyltransferase
VVVPEGDVQRLAEAMARLMDDEDARARLAARAVEIVERYGVERVLGLWEDLLGALVPRQAGAAGSRGQA